MKINRSSSENELPSWAMGGIEDKVDALEKSAVDLSEAKQRMPESLSEEKVVEEREQIEKCAAEGDTYHYDSNWEADKVSSLKEYAQVMDCKCEGIGEVEPQTKEPEKQSDESKLTAWVSERTIRTAEVAEPNEDPFANLKLNDPFGIDEIDGTIEKEDWEKVDSESKLTRKPDVLANGASSVKAIGGGEDYFTNSDTPLASNQNSIVNPDAIKDLEESKVEDTGVRLAREAKEKEASKETRHQEWQQGKVDAMEHLEDLPSGSVFPTEVMNAQPGLGNPSSQMGVYAAFDKDSIPEKTEGESIAASNEDRRREIQGKDKEETQFEMQSQSSRGISDNFADALKTALNK